jgi:hypothetical protein
MALLVGLCADRASAQVVLSAVPMTNAPQEAVTNSVVPTLDITEAPARMIMAEKPIPAQVRTSGPFAEIVKLANSGMDEKVMLAFVTNSTSIFNLSADEIVYLNDIGVPAPVITTIIERDHQLLKSTSPAPTAQPVPEAVSLNVAALPPPQPAAPQPDYTYPMEPYAVPAYAQEPDYAPFYDALSPYGAWADVEGYGPCWQPTVGVINPSWQPYFDSGYWVYTDCGWYWLSDYSWGWAPFHYGRWFHHKHLGWCWAPGTVWGPSWVSWRYNDGFCGWAPLPPGAYFSVGAGLTLQGRRVQDHDDLGLPPGRYRFVAWNHFLDRHLNQQSLSPQQASQVFSRSTPVTRITRSGRWINNDALPIAKVASATRAPVRSVAVREMSSTTGGSRSEKFEANRRILTVYRPRMPDASSTRSPGSEPISRPSSSAPTGRPAAPPGGARPRTAADRNLEYLWGLDEPPQSLAARAASAPTAGSAPSAPSARSAMAPDNSAGSSRGLRQGAPSANQSRRSRVVSSSASSPARNSDPTRGGMPPSSTPAPWIRPQRAEPPAQPASAPTAVSGTEVPRYTPPSMVSIPGLLPFPQLSRPALAPAATPQSAFGPPPQLVVPQSSFANPGPATAPLAPPVQLPPMINMGGIYSAPAGLAPSAPSALSAPGVIGGRR